MFRRKQKKIISNKESGFTIIELLVVISIMGILMSVIVANIAGQRDHQKLRIAQNEMVTNIRKLQSYTLSSRTLPNGKSAQYYILKMDIATPDRYTIQAIYDVMSSPQLFNLETVYFPSGIRLAAANPVVISRPGIIPGQTPSGHTCSLLIFKLPFAKTLMSYGSVGGCVQNSWDPNTDDYEKIVNFVVNTNNQPVSVDSDMAIKISTQDGTITKNIYIDGVTGLVNF